jgi:hypothetical protein
LLKSKELVAGADAETSPALKITRALLQDARQEIVRADEKATVFLTSVGIIVSAFMTLGAGGWQLTHASVVVGVLVWLAIAHSGFGVGCLISVIWPRYHRYHLGDRALAVGYFGDVVEAARRGNLDVAIDTASRNEFRHALDQLRSVSRIAAIKYRRIRLAVVSLMGAVVLGIVALTVHFASG